MTHYDIIIVGGGMVGLTLACALQKLPLKIAIIDASKPPTKDSLNYNLRVSAVTAASQRIFKNLGVWKRICELGVSPYESMQVWDSETSGALRFDSETIGETCLGSIISNQVISCALYEDLLDFGQVECLYSLTPKELEKNNNLTTIKLNNEKELTAKLVIGADGVNSWLREKSGIAYRGWDYQQVAIVASVETELSHQRTAWQRFSTTGPLAFLPLIDEHHSSIVWSAEKAYSEKLLALSDEAFKQELEKEFEHRLGSIITVTERRSFPLVMRHAENYVKPGVALVGDAIHRIHPLAGQGANLGFMDAACLADVLTIAVEQKRDIGDILTLKPYERWRKSDVLLMIGAMELFKRGFSSQIKPVQWLREQGLNITDKLDFMKRKLIRQAMGLVGELPSLAKFLKD